MGTNYYFKIENNTDIIFKDINNLLKKVDIKLFDQKKLKELKEKLVSTIKDNIEFTFDEYTKLHICKLSYGWSPLFQSTKHYASWKELVDFYENNKDQLTIINEYNETITFKELQKKIYTYVGGKRHDTLADPYSFVTYFICKDDYDWTPNDFS